MIEWKIEPLQMIGQNLLNDNNKILSHSIVCHFILSIVSPTVWYTFCPTVIFILFVHRDNRLHIREVNARQFVRLIYPELLRYHLYNYYVTGWLYRVSIYEFKCIFFFILIDDAYHQFYLSYIPPYFMKFDIIVFIKNLNILIEEFFQQHMSQPMSYNAS